MNNLKPYKRGVYYYETDKMGIMHHSNYIRIFEETRVDFLNQVGMPFDKIEALGIMMPVLSVESHYKYPLRFGDSFEVYPCITKFNGATLSITYTIKNAETGDICAVGNSSHCFTDMNMKPIRTKRNYPEVYRVFADYVEISPSED